MANLTQISPARDQLKSVQANQANHRVNWPVGLGESQRNELWPLLFEPIDFMDDPSFHEPRAMRKIFAPEREVPRPSIGWYTRLAHERPNHLKLKNATLPLLTAQQEKDVFLQFNYARFRAEQVRASIGPLRMGVAKPRELLKWHGLALELREKIAEYNLALVLALSLIHI